MADIEKRKLKAVVFTDIQGYTAMMQRDEEAAIAAVEKHKQALEQIIPAFDGEIKHYYGDGSLSTFDSAIMALRASIELQRRFSKESKIPVRIGIHIGEILYRGEEFYGDGVNIASRIQSLGVAGSILFSEDVYQKVKNQAEFEITELGPHNLKNVSEPVKIYGLRNEGLTLPSTISPQQKTRLTSRKWLLGMGALIAVVVILWSTGVFAPPSSDSPTADFTFLFPTKKSLAVLPFADIQEEAGEDYFVNGMHESLIFDLSKIKALRVTSRTSVTRFRSTEYSIPEIANELGVDVLIEGSVMKIGNDVRITVQLIDGKLDEHIWSGQYDRSLENVLVLISDIARDISKEVEVALSLEEENLLAKAPVKPEAYELYLRGRYFFNQFTAEGFEEALAYFDQALEIDSAFALAWVGRATVNTFKAYWGIEPSGNLLPVALHDARQAIKLDPNLSECHGSLGWIHMMNWEWPEAKAAFRRALDIDQNDPYALHGTGDYLTLIGRAEEGLEFVRLAAETDPFSPGFSLPVQGHLYMMRRYEEALIRLEDFLNLHPDYPVSGWSNLIYWKLGRYEESIDAFRLANADDSLMLAAIDSGRSESGPLGALQAAAQLLEDRYSKDADSDVNALQISRLYARIENADKTMEWLEESYDNKEASLFYVAVRPEYIFLQSDPRFKKLLRKMGLPPEG